MPFTPFYIIIYVMLKEIKKIEDLSLNAWPSHQMQVYDGWILRFSYFYTHRTNCVEQIGPSILPLEEKISYCEEIYRYWQTPCIFKISPVGSPDLDPLLEARGYEIEHATQVMVRSLGDLSPTAHPAEPYPLTVRARTDAAWIDGLFCLKGGVSPIHRRIVPNMYAAIPKDEIAVAAYDGGTLIGTGLGILDRDTVGIYAIHVRDDYRRRGLASGIVSRILTEARKQGAAGAYLQVVSDNAPARQLYRRLGFRDSYRYYFRVRRL